MSIYAEIIINSDASEVDRPFTYKIPDEFIDKVDVGYRVKVPFGKGNRNVDGFIFRILTEELEFKYKIKCIVDVNGLSTSLASLFIIISA